MTIFTSITRSSWKAPGVCPAGAPTPARSRKAPPAGAAITFTRLLDKPFTVTEYNYSGPGRFRGVGGILTGAMGALQGWGGIWRFAYSHSRNNMFNPSPMGYFDMATDPLSQAAERASLCLFLRGDLQTAPHSVGLGHDRSRPCRARCQNSHSRAEMALAGLGNTRWHSGRAGARPEPARIPGVAARVADPCLGLPGQAGARLNPYTVESTA